MSLLIKRSIWKPIPSEILQRLKNVFTSLMDSFFLTFARVLNNLIRSIDRLEEHFTPVYEYPPQQLEAPSPPTDNLAVSLSQQSTSPKPPTFEDEAVKDEYRVQIKQKTGFRREPYTDRRNRSMSKRRAQSMTSLHFQYEASGKSELCLRRSCSQSEVNRIHSVRDFDSLCGMPADSNQLLTEGNLRSEANTSYDASQKSVSLNSESQSGETSLLSEAVNEQPLMFSIGLDESANLPSTQDKLEQMNFLPSPLSNSGRVISTDIKTEESFQTTERASELTKSPSRYLKAFSVPDCSGQSNRCMGEVRKNESQFLLRGVLPTDACYYFSEATYQPRNTPTLVFHEKRNVLLYETVKAKIVEERNIRRQLREARSKNISENASAALLKTNVQSGPNLSDSTGSSLNDRWMAGGGAISRVPPNQRQISKNTKPYYRHTLPRDRFSIINASSRFSCGRNKYKDAAVQTSEESAAALTPKCSVGSLLSRRNLSKEDVYSWLKEHASPSQLVNEQIGIVSVSPSYEQLASSSPCKSPRLHAVKMRRSRERVRNITGNVEKERILRLQSRMSDSPLTILDDMDGKSSETYSSVVSQETTSNQSNTKGLNTSISTERTNEVSNIEPVYEDNVELGEEMKPHKSEDAPPSIDEDYPENATSPSSMKRAETRRRHRQEEVKERNPRNQKERTHQKLKMRKGMK